MLGYLGIVFKNCSLADAPMSPGSQTQAVLNRNVPKLITVDMLV